MEKENFIKKFIEIKIVKKFLCACVKIIFLEKFKYKLSL